MSSAREPGGAIVIGVGNSWAGDDGVGLRVIDALGERVPDGVVLARHEGEPTTLLDLWEGASEAIVIDAVTAGGEPGAVSSYDASERPLPSSFTGSSTHAFSVAQAIELGRALGRLPGRVVVVGIEAAEFDSGTSISASVADGIEPAAEAVLAELGRG